MSFLKRKNRPHQPSRQKLDIAISNILDQAINIDSEHAPKQLRLLLIQENPLWKLPERRVARYLKRHLAARKNPQADNIDVDEDEQTVYTTVSTLSAATGTRDSTLPSITQNDSIPEDKMPSPEKPSNDINNDANTEGTGNNTDQSIESREIETVTKETEESPTEPVAESKNETERLTERLTERGIEVVADDVLADKDVTNDDAYKSEKDKNDDCFGFKLEGCVIS